MIFKLLGLTSVYTHPYEIHERVIKKGTSREEKAASRTQIMKEEEFLLLGKLKPECSNNNSERIAECTYFTHIKTVFAKVKYYSNKMIYGLYCKFSARPVN